MADSRIQLIFEAIDRATGTINKVDQGLNKVKASSNTLSTAIGTAMGGLAVTAVQGALSAISSGVGAITGELDRAATAIDKKVTDTAGISAMLNIPFAVAEKNVKNFNSYINSSFQGNTEKLKGLGIEIIDTFSLASKEVNGAFNFDEINRRTAKVAENLSLMGVNAEEANDLLGGQKSAEELKELDGLNSKFIDMINTEAKKRFMVKDLSELKASQITELVEELSDKFLPEEAKAKIRQSYIKQSESLAKLFTLDFSLDVNQLGGKNVSMAATDILTSLNDLFTSIGQAFGLNKEDAYVSIFNALTNIAGGIDNFRRFFESIANTLNTGVGLDDGTNIAEIFRDVAKRITESFYTYADSIDYGDILYALGDIFVVLLSAVTGIVYGVGEATVARLEEKSTELYTTVFDAIGNAFNSIIETTTAFITDGANAFISLIQTAINNFWTMLSKAVNQAIQSAVSNIGSFGSGFIQGLTGGGNAIPQASVPQNNTANNNYSTSNNPIFNANLNQSISNQADGKQMIDILNREYSLSLLGTS